MRVRLLKIDTGEYSWRLTWNFAVSVLKNGNEVCCKGGKLFCRERDKKLVCDARAWEDTAAKSKRFEQMQAVRKRGSAQAAVAHKNFPIWQRSPLRSRQNIRESVPCIRPF